MLDKNTLKNSQKLQTSETTRKLQAKLLRYYPAILEISTSFQNSNESKDSVLHSFMITKNTSPKYGKDHHRSPVPGAQSMFQVRRYHGKIENTSENISNSLVLSLKESNV